MRTALILALVAAASGLLGSGTRPAADRPATLLAMHGVVSPEAPDEAVAAHEPATFDETIERSSRRMIAEGRQIFRDDTFGDEAFWGGALRLHEAIAGAALGGVGPGVSPRTALAVGLKVDAERLPPELVSAIKRGKVDLDAPATTLALLRLNSVVGVTGFFEKGKLRSMGIQ